MLQTGHGRLILMSSQKASGDTRDIVDIGLLRSSHIASNHVYYVCPPHLKEMSSRGFIANTCICYIFFHPFHIKKGGSFQALTELFSNNTEVTNSPLLTELGIDLNLINDDIHEMSNKNLCTRKAHMHVQTTSISLKALIKNNRPDALVSDTVMVYIDPAPIVSDMSLNAMCFTTCITHILSNEASHKHVIIAVENFKSDQFDKETYNYQIAISNILMKNIVDIFEVFSGHFKRFVVAPEADSIPMEQFWVQCQHLYTQNRTFLAKNGPKVFFTTIRKTLSKNTKDNLCANIENIPEYDNMKVMAQATPDRKRKFRADENDIDIYVPVRKNLTSMHFRVGYNLGHEKTKIYLDFILKQYNTLNVICASEVFSNTLCASNISIPTLVVESLDVLTIKSKSNNQMKLYISGKSRKNGDYIQDDLADAIIMSVMLFPVATGQNPLSTPLYELKPELNDSGVFSSPQSQECVITASQFF